MVGLIETVPHLHTALSTARRTDLARIDEALRRFGVTGVHGEAEVGTTSLIETAIRHSEQDCIRVDLDSASGEADVAWLLARGLARTVMGPSAFAQMHGSPTLRPTSAQRAYVDFAQRVGEPVARFALADESSDEVGVDETLAAMGRVFAQAVMPPILWIDHLQAPALTPRHPLDVNALLWNVRGLQQRLELPILLSGNQTATPLAFGPSGAFHGDGIWITLSRPGLDAWLEVGDSLQDAAPSGPWIVEMAEITHGHPATMLLALALYVEVPERARTPVELWQLMLALDDGYVGRALQHARSLHRLGGRVLEQIARGVGPYEDIQSTTRRKEINRAVRRLHEGGLITQPRPRAWEVTNPLLAGRLRGGLPLTSSEASAVEAYDWSGFPQP